MFEKGNTLGFKKGSIPWNKDDVHTGMVGDKHWNWQGGISKDKSNKINKIRAWRHRTGRSKKYSFKYGGVQSGFSRTDEYKRLHRKLYKALKKKGGKLSIQTIQMIYEDNIKRYGTLTCYLCLDPIPFGKDHLEHKIPLSRGGSNEYNNLAVACQHCNCKKHNKTETEYKIGG
jgi:5-methylcytosine-specific restriction endonuclease McrA